MTFCWKLISVNDEPFAYLKCGGGQSVKFTELNIKKKLSPVTPSDSSKKGKKL